MVAARGRMSQGLCPRAVAHATSYGCWTSGFFSQEVVEHVCGVGFIRQNLDLPRSNKLSHCLLGCWILTQHRAMVAPRCRGVQIQQASMCDFRWWCAHDNLLCLLETFCLMPKTKFDFDTMLNILLAMRCVIPCCICQSGCRRGSIEQEHQEHENYMVWPCRPTSMEESLKGYIFIVLECCTITRVTMNSNMSIYRRLNPRLLVQAGVGLSLLHWINMSNNL